MKISSVKSEVREYKPSFGRFSQILALSLASIYGKQLTKHRFNYSQPEFIIVLYTIKTACRDFKTLFGPSCGDLKSSLISYINEDI